MVIRETERNRGRAGSGLKVHEEVSWRGIREKPSGSLHEGTELHPHSVSSVLYRKLAEEKYEEVHARRRELRSRHFEKVSVDVLNVRNTLLFLWYSIRASWVSLLFSESNWVPVKHSFNAFPPTVRRAERTEPARVGLSQSAARMARTLEGRRRNRSRTSQNQNCTVRKRLLQQQTWRLVHRHAFTHTRREQLWHRRRLRGVELPRGVERHKNHLKEHKRKMSKKTKNKCKEIKNNKGNCLWSHSLLNKCIIH